MTQMLIEVDPVSNNKFNALVNAKVKQGEFLASSTVRTEVAKAIFTITARKFLKDLNIAAKENPKKFHHIYEWDSIGKTSEMLFLMKRAGVQAGNLKIVIVPLRSSKIVPIREELSTPGPSGRKVDSEHIFKDKMKVMEEGQPVRIEVKSAKALAFVGTGPSANEQGIIFWKKERGPIIVPNPGGDQVKGALTEFLRTWYETKAPLTFEQSGMGKKIVSRVAVVLNSNDPSISSIYNAVKEVNSSYSQELTVI